MSEVSADAFNDETPASDKPITIVPSIDAHQALDISALSDEQKATVGHNLQEEITEDSKHVMARYLRIGRNLRVFARNQLYAKLGFDSFDEWRAQPELNLSRSTSYALMKVFEIFVERLKVMPQRLQNIDWTKLYGLSRVVTAENVDDYLSKAETLSRTDLQRELSLVKARLAGKTEVEAEAQQDVLDFARQCCPINCGAKCSLIDADQDAAVESFKKFLGKWKSISARIKSLFGKPIATRQNETEKNDSPLPADAGTPPPGDRRKSYVPERNPVEPGDEAPVHGENPDAVGKVLEGASVADGKAGDKKVWA